MEQSNLGVIIILAGMIILGLALYFWESQVASKMPELKAEAEYICLIR